MYSTKINLKFDLIIIGAGALGSFHALFALQKGLKVLLIEKDFRPSEATVRNFGQIIPSGMSPGLWFDYARAGLETYKSIQQEYDISVRQQGSTYLASSDLEWAVLQESATRYRSLEYPCELLTTQQCLSIHPDLNSGYVRGALRFPDELSVEPNLMIHRLLQYLVAKYDLNYHPSTPVKELNLSSSSVEVVDSKGLRYYGAKVLLCNGRDFQFLLPELFQRSDLELVKLQMMETAPIATVRLNGSILTGLSIHRYPAFKACESYPAMIQQAGLTELKDAQIHILLKQAADGSIIIGDSHEYAQVALADTIDFGTDERINQLILDEAKRIIVLPDWTIRRKWNGYYSQSKSKEIFDHTIEGRLQVVTGIGGKGMTTACGYAEKNIEKNYASM